MTEIDNTIYIDDREKRDVQLLAEVLYDNMRIERLEIGDVLARGIIFELKRPPDFISSIFDKRLFIQIFNMTEKYKNAFLLVSGSFIETELLYNSRSKNSNFPGVIASCIARGCIPIFTGSIYNSLILIDSISKKYTDGKIRDRPTKTVTLKDKQMSIICSLPGISETLAKSLLSHFGSVGAIFAADEAALKEVAKIGPKKANKIVRLNQKPYIV